VLIFLDESSKPTMISAEQGLDVPDAGKLFKCFYTKKVGYEQTDTFVRAMFQQISETQFIASLINVNFNSKQKTERHKLQFDERHANRTALCIGVV